MFVELICALNWELVFLPCISDGLHSFFEIQFFLSIELRSYSKTNLLESLSIKKVKSYSVLNIKYTLISQITNSILSNLNEK